MQADAHDSCRKTATIQDVINLLALPDGLHILANIQRLYAQRQDIIMTVTPNIPPLTAAFLILYLLNGNLVGQRTFDQRRGRATG